ncbi:MAG: MarR family winged helix-turn-helix transcriptional regulator [Candidatus Kapaibacterium sp.]
MRVVTRINPYLCKVMGEILRNRIQQSQEMSPYVDAMLNVLVCADYFRRLSEQVCSEHGISLIQYNVLRILKGAHPGGHSRCDIRSRLVERGTDITRLVDKLEAQGFAERTRSETDKRYSHTKITTKGIQLLQTLHPKIEAIDNMLSEVISHKEAEKLSEICEKIYSNEE